ncbi:MAG: amidohydrolase family protein, partial [Herbiconiux sp.]|nr:amidohydrolase family protein [Herbiconiux sp.]
YFQGAAFENRYGRRATEWAPPVTKLLAAGLTVGAGTDSTRVSSYNPWLALHWLTTGADIAGSRRAAAANLVDRATALEMYTVAGAALSGESHAKGRIEVGMYADLVILSADYFTVPDAEIPFIEAELTVVGGRIVYASDAYEGQAEPLETPSQGWSPVVHFGGYHRASSGVAQAEGFVEASADSAEQRAWRERRGETVALHEHHPLRAHDH